MKLTKEDKNILISWGYTDSDLNQIETALNKTTYTLESDNNRVITAKEAKSLLGNEVFLSGLSRSAFHWTSSRKNDNNEVNFNSSKIFK